MADLELARRANGAGHAARSKRARDAAEITVTFRGWKAHFADFDPHDHILTQMRGGRFYEDDLLEAVFHTLKPGSQIIDVGACIGTFTIFCALVLGASVTAAEPDAGNMRQLRKNVRRNGLTDRTKLVRTGIGASGEKRAIMQTIPGNTGARQLREAGAETGNLVTLRSLSSIWPKKRVDLLKIDTEGMELDVLESGREAIRKDRPIIVVECGGEDALRRMDACMDSLGYAFHSRYCYTPTLMYRPRSLSNR